MNSIDRENRSYKAAHKRMKDIKGFYVHLLVYLLVNIALLIGITNFKGLENSQFEVSNFYTALFWGIGLAAHWVNVFGPGMILGKKWEEKKIRELMDKDKEEMQKWK